MEHVTNDSYWRFADLVSRGIVSNNVTLSRWLKAGNFPRPLYLTSRCRVWRVEDVRSWLETRARGAA